MEVIKSELYTSLIMATIVTLLVWLNTPRTEENKHRTTRILIKTWVLSFIAIYVIYYFTFTGSDKKSEDVMDNIIRTEPDF